MKRQPSRYTFANALSGYKKLAIVPKVKEIIEGYNVNLQSKYTYRDVTQENFNWNDVMNKYKFSKSICLRSFTQTWENLRWVF